ncbi:HEAT repeat domain-containing protein [Methanobacterium sp.]|uniref:HEAT repeat domain-containing protein n=1 Tax=Methanobacterium sp. TaxID=2164 RepID=UPI003C7699AF
MAIGKVKPNIDRMERCMDVEGLISALKFKDCNIRKEAVTALKKIADNRSLFPLIDVLGYKEWHDYYAVMGSVRETAAEALGVLRDRRAVEPLIKALNDKDEEVRWKAAWALGNIRDRRAVEPLIYLLHDKSWAVRRFAASALGKIGDERAVESLMKALSDEEWHVRKYAADALGKIGDERAVESLMDALHDKDSDVRWKAAVALGKMKSAAVEPLIELLKNDDWHIRGRAAEALGKIGDERAVKPLINSLVGWNKDRNKYVRGRAAEALGKIGDEDAIKPLTQALEDPYIYVRVKVEEALKEMETATQVQNYDDGEISFDYPGSWEVVSTTDKKKIVKGNSANGSITFSINKNTNVSDLTSKEVADTIRDVFIIQNSAILSETEFTADGIDVHTVIGENANNIAPTKIMVISFKIEDLLYYLWFSGGHESFERAQKEIDLIIDNFRVYI